MKNRTKEKQRLKSQNAVSKNQYGIVGVIGSNPLASTTLKIPKHIELIEIPGDWEPLVGIRWPASGPELFQVLRKTTSKRFENDLNGKRSKKSA